MLSKTASLSATIKALRGMRVALQAKYMKDDFLVNGNPLLVFGDKLPKVPKARDSHVSDSSTTSLLLTIALLTGILGP
jgi:hypothetical protein